MKKQLIRMAMTAGLAGLASTSVQAATAFEFDGSAYTQDFDSLERAGTSSALPTGWLLYETGRSDKADGKYTPGAGGSSAGDSYSFGRNGTSPDRALGTVRDAGFSAIFGAVFTNTSGATITDLAIGYTGELWRNGVANSLDGLTFQYSTDATSLTVGTWTTVDALGFSLQRPGSGQKVGNADVNRADLDTTLTGLTIEDGETFWFRWLDNDVATAESGLAVDDFSLSVPAAVPEPASWAMMIAGFGLVGGALRRQGRQGALRTA